jgi:superfamily I DNA and/or RNA helicase
VEDRWEPGTASVQTVADAVNPLGTSLGPTWVGCPLRVHRRCAEPMFSISNHIAYDGTMVSATPSRASVIGDLMGESRWIDIPGVPGGGHHAEAQAEMVERILRRLTRTLTVDQLDLYVISPFRLMASGLQARLRPLGDDAWARWVRNRVGTIHTAQGREAEAVILVLGGDPERRGALLWAGATPNIL